MRHFYRVTFLATVFTASCWQSSDFGAGTFASDLVKRLNPLAFWHFDGDNEQVLLDETERYVGLSQGGATITTRQAIQSESGGAMSFDGQRGCIVVRHDDEFLLEQGTIACWLRADDVDRFQGILSKDASGFGDGGHLTMSLAQGQIVVRLQSTTESYEVRAAASKDRWTHVAFAFGSDGMRLFLDGKLANSHDYVGGLGGSSGGTGNHEPLVFGASTMTSQAASESPLTDFFRGDVDEVAVFARQLASSEIAELVDAARPRYTSLMGAYVANRPLAWWRLNEAEGGTVALDQVGRQHGIYNVVGSSYFDGDDFVDVGALDLDDTSFTILAHIKPRSFAVADARIIAKENGLNEEDQFWSLSTTMREDRAQLRFRLRTENGTRETVSRDRNININEQLFVAAVYDGQRMQLYVDGEVVSEVAHRGRPRTNAHCHVWIGDSPSGAGNRPFDGRIRDVAILQEAISPDQIRAIFHASREQRVAPPVVSPADLPPVTEAPELLPPVTKPAAPFVHRCPLCDIRYREIVIHRVPLPGTVPLPICETPHLDAVYP